MTAATTSSAQGDGARLAPVTEFFAFWATELIVWTAAVLSMGMPVVVAIVLACGMPAVRGGVDLALRVAATRRGDAR